MKTVLKYVADDGSEFESEQQCVEYEDLAKEVNDLLALLPERPSNCDFSNGGGYIQHDKDIFLNMREALLKIVMRYSTHRWIREALEKPEVHPSWVGRIINDSCPRPIRSAWDRIHCTSKDFKEYGQPYYAYHQEEAENVCLNRN